MAGSIPWLTTRPSRAIAFAIHLTLSLLIFSTLVFMMAFYWFPGSLFFIDGGWQGLKLVAMIDLVLGPALTLFLYKPGKPKLVMDMSMIAALQVAALGYGFYTTHDQRTAAIVYADRGFNTLAARDHLEANQELLALDRQPQSIAKAGFLSLPKMLAPAPGKGEFGQYMSELLNGYPEPHARSDLYVPLADNLHQIKQDALSESQLADSGALSAVTTALGKHDLELGDVDIYRFKARYANGVLLFDPVTVSILDYVTYDAPVSAPDATPGTTPANSPVSPTSAPDAEAEFAQSSEEP